MRKYNKETLEELCKEHNIDTDLAEEFIEETNAFPFLLGQPSTYFVSYLKLEKEIDIADKQKQIIFEKLIRNDKIKEIVILMYSYDKREIPECQECNKKKYDYATMIDDNGNEKTICFSCFLKKYFHIIFDIKEEDVKNFFNELKNNQFIYATEKILILNLIQYYYLDNEKISSKKFIKDLVAGNKISFERDINKHVRDMYEKIHTIYIYRETYPNSKQKIDVIEILDSISRNEKFINAPIDTIETTKAEIKSVFGAEIEPWIIEKKFGPLESGFITGVIKESEKAFFCYISLLNKKQNNPEWIPKSQVQLDNKNFIKKIIENTLKTIGGII